MKIQDRKNYRIKLRNHLLTCHWLVATCIILASCRDSTSIELELNSLFSNHMVLQQEDKVSIWGLYSPGKEVVISASWGSSSTVIPNENGEWIANLSTPEAGGPYEISVNSQDTSITLEDVMVGEVWIASGQSNMEMPLTGYLPAEPIQNYEEEIAQADYIDIRMFTVKKNMSPTKLNEITGEWQVCFPDYASGFSATGYFFARSLNRQLGEPIGIIHSSWGGTEAEAWTSKEGLERFPDFIEEIEAFDANEIQSWVDAFDLVAKPETLEEFEELKSGDDDMALPDYVDDSWTNATLPHDGCKANDFIRGTVDSFYLNGIFWYRKTIQLKDVDSDYHLSIGAIDDADVIYVNGIKVGSTMGWQTNRIYEVPASILQEGSNVIAIRQYDSGGGSAIVGPMFLSNGNGQNINLEGTWKALFYADLSIEGILIYGEEHQERLKERPRSIYLGPNQLASSLFNAMIHPLIPYGLRGAIWYQGESNVGRSLQYETLFPAMITDWRNHWGKEFPFYFVQIAPFSYGSGLSPALRDAQRKSLKTPATGMAVAMDIGESESIHPANKQDVGYRLALLALDKDYGLDVVSSGPLYKDHIIDGDKIVVAFDHKGSGLWAKSTPLTSFEIAGADKKFMPAMASIVDDKVEVRNEAIERPVYVRYGWSDFLLASLFNKEGLPASSFTTDQ